jgi:hypothetical protein
MSKTENNFLIHRRCLLAIGKESVGGNQGRYQGMVFFFLFLFFKLFLGDDCGDRTWTKDMPNSSATKRTRINKKHIPNSEFRRPHFSRIPRQVACMLETKTSHAKFG